MFNFITKIFDENSKKVSQYSKTFHQINSLESKYQKLSDKQLPGKTAEFKKIIADLRKQGKEEKTILAQLLPDAFATVRETSRRVLGMRHFDVQLLAGIALHNGTVTEQKT